MRKVMLFVTHALVVAAHNLSFITQNQCPMTHQSSGMA
jgi:hypothetical protein